MMRSVANLSPLLLCGVLAGCVLFPLDDLAPPKKQEVQLGQMPVTISLDRYLFSRGYTVTFALEPAFLSEKIAVSVSNLAKMPLKVGYGATFPDWKVVYLEPGKNSEIYTGSAADFFRNWRMEVASTDSGRSILQISVSPLSHPFQGGKLIVYSKAPPHPFL